MVSWCAHKADFHRSPMSTKSSHHTHAPHPPPPPACPGLLGHQCRDISVPGNKVLSLPAAGCSAQGHPLGVRKARTPSQPWPEAATVSWTSHCPSVLLSLLSDRGTCLPPLQPRPPGFRWNGPLGHVGPATAQTLTSQQGDPCHSGCKPSDDLNKPWLESRLQWGY